MLICCMYIVLTLYRQHNSEIKYARRILGALHNALNTQNAHKVSMIWVESLTTSKLIALHIVYINKVWVSKITVLQLP